MSSKVQLHPAHQMLLELVYCWFPAKEEWGLNLQPSGPLLWNQVPVQVQEDENFPLRERF